MFTQITTLTADNLSCQAVVTGFAPFALVALPYMLLILVSVVLIKIR